MRPIVFSIPDLAGFFMALYRLAGRDPVRAVVMRPTSRP